MQAFSKMSQSIEILAITTLLSESKEVLNSFLFSFGLKSIFAYFLFGNTNSFLDLKLDIILYFFLLGVVLTLSSNNLLYAHKDGLLNMSVDMILKMNETSAINATDNAIQHDTEKITSMSHNQSKSIESYKGSKGVKNMVNYETSGELAKSLKILFSSYLQDFEFENSTGLMPIPTEMKINAIRDLGQGIDNLVLALNRSAAVEEVYSIVHGLIHPNLFLAFSLKLNSD